MTRPVPAPKTPRPIRDDPKVGQLAVVVSFRVGDRYRDPERLRQVFIRALTGFLDLADLTVHVRVIGAGGETSEDEGRWDHPSVLANTDDIEHVHPTTDIPTGGKT